jgi:hypothetical protein
MTRGDLSPALAAQIDDMPPASEWDVFLVIGQSIPVGSGGGVIDTKVLPAGICKQYYSGALTAKTGDKIGNAQNNSPWPAHALEHWKRTGRGVVYVPAAVGSSSLLAAADNGSGNWSSTGTLRDDAITLLNAAKAAADSAGLAWKFAGVIYGLGESDAFEIDQDTAGVTKANHLTEMGTLLTYLQTQTGSGSTMPFIIIQIGQPSTGATAGYDDIREAQVEFSHGRPNVFIGYTGAKNFAARNMLWDHIHPNALGCDEMGTALGRVTAVVCTGRA